jgi:UDP-3-O-[3-hydroxymyristoyl] glucosamine N-acyltransferase
VTFHARCQIGKRGIIHSGAVIGTDGLALPTKAACTSRFRRPAG